MDWKDCINKSIIKDVKPDQDLIKSLIKSSKNKLESAMRLEMSHITATSKLSLAYDSFREILEAFALKTGYKVYNHECYTAFLKEIIKESAKGDEFDEIRRLRNAVNYYGKDITTAEATEIISRIHKLRIYIFDLIEK